MDDSKKIIDLVTLNTFKEEILEEVNQKLINLLATDNEVEEFISALYDYVDAEGDKVAGLNDKIDKLQIN